MRSESARKARIEEIASQIAELSDELKTLILEDEQASVENNKTISASGTTSTTAPLSSRARSSSSRFQVGDRIAITNNYKGHFGRTGTVIKVDEENEWVHFHQDTPSLRTKRKSHNIRHLD